MRITRSAIALGVAVLLGGCSGGTSDHHLTGSFSIEHLVRGSTENAPCEGRNASTGYADIDAGTTVVVKNGNDHTIGVTALGQGRIENGTASVNGYRGTCTWRFRLDVADTPFYSIEVGHRGAISYSRAQMEQKNWRVVLSLGS